MRVWDGSAETESRDSSAPGLRPPCSWEVTAVTESWSSCPLRARPVQKGQQVVTAAVVSTLVCKAPDASPESAEGRGHVGSMAAPFMPLSRG